MCAYHYTAKARDAIFREEIRAELQMTIVAGWVNFIVQSRLNKFFGLILGTMKDAFKQSDDEGEHRSTLQMTVLWGQGIYLHNSCFAGELCNNISKHVYYGVYFEMKPLLNQQLLFVLYLPIVCHILLSLPCRIVVVYCALTVNGSACFLERYGLRHLSLSMEDGDLRSVLSNPMPLLEWSCLGGSQVV